MTASDATVPLDFDAWMDLSARLLHLDMDQRLDVLEEREVTLEDWSRAEEHFAAALAADIVAGRMDRAESYGRKCAAEMQRRTRQAESQPEHARADAEATPPAQDPAPAPAPPPLPSVEPAVPTFMQESPPVSARPAIPKDLAGTISVDNLPSFIKQGASKPLPFGATPSAEFLAAANAPKPPAPANAGETLGLDTDAASQVRAAFGAKHADGVRKPAPLVGETLSVDSSVFAPPSVALPFPASERAPRTSAPIFPRLPLQTYASLCVELELYPTRAAEVLAKYGVKDEQARRALDQDWHARFTAHPDTREEWVKACATYREWLFRQPR